MTSFSVNNSNDPSWTWLVAFNEAEMEERKRANTTFACEPCGLRFIDDHFGLRPGCLHTLLGSTGRGKSTLVQSLILEWGKKSSLLLYLSEESIERVEVKLFQKDRNAEYLSPRLHMVHEEEFLSKIDPKNYLLFIEMLRCKLQASEAKILIIDNITTSQFYEGQFKNVVPLLAKLRSLAKEFEIPIFLVCHTKKGVNETTKGIISPDDVRGSASLAMTSDYFYILYRIIKTDDVGRVRNGAFIYVSKSRDHENQDMFYRLDYDIHKKRYVGDAQIPFKTFKEFMKDRDKL